jgi:DNA polymerase/3'-5' exonuclease PolX
MDNQTIANRLMRHAHQLEMGRANLYRIRAYRRAAATLLTLEKSVAEVVAEEGRRGLEVLPGIGPHLSYTIEELVRTGEWRTVNP